jgi:hypothetical protein
MNSYERIGVCRLGSKIMDRDGIAHQGKWNWDEKLRGAGKSHTGKSGWNKDIKVLWRCGSYKILNINVRY